MAGGGSEGSWKNRARGIRFFTRLAGSHGGGIEAPRLDHPRARLGTLEGPRPGGAEVLDINLTDFAARLRQENHTLKRSLTDPRLFSGIGNAYSDEILHRAQLSPVKHSRKLTEEEIVRLLAATKSVLLEWTERLRTECGSGFPGKVTAFHEQMAVHGKFGQSCPVCRSLVQRIRYADNETDYCARCQTGGKLLADRALSRLLRSDWPRTAEELEDVKREE